MNYNTIDEILAAGTTNMTVLRNNTKQDDGTDTITGVSWFFFNGTVASNVYASGNSFIGFGSNSEHLKVNRRDGALWSLYREEGTLYNYYKFLKIRWDGYSHYNYSNSSHALIYDVILWDTGDISLHMVSMPTSYNTGTYSLVASSTYSYLVNNSSPDVTFIKINSGFEVKNSIIDLAFPYNEKYLIRSGSNYYTIANNALVQIPNVNNLTSSLFLEHGIDIVSDFSLLRTVSNPELLYWTDREELVPKQGLVVTGIPELPYVIYYKTKTMSSAANIQKMEMSGSDDVLLSISFDQGQTWKYYDSDNWKIAASANEGMTKETLKNISSSKWSEIKSSNAITFRASLMSADSYVGKIYLKIT